MTIRVLPQLVQRPRAYVNPGVAPSARAAIPAIVRLLPSLPGVPIRRTLARHARQKSESGCRVR